MAAGLDRLATSRVAIRTFRSHRSEPPCTWVPIPTRRTTTIAGAWVSRAESEFARKTPGGIRVAAPSVLFHTESCPDPDCWNDDFNSLSAELVEELGVDDDEPASSELCIKSRYLCRSLYQST